ncbi:hypothetical protein KAI92_05425 [Candidatus Parcubacteria bacterium]|nr:hypothetical protein [Candidatus Parcubacteria bacterium]
MIFSVKLIIGCVIKHGLINEFSINQPVPGFSFLLACTKIIRLLSASKE